MELVVPSPVVDGVPGNPLLVGVKAVELLDPVLAAEEDADDADEAIEEATELTLDCTLLRLDELDEAPEEVTGKLLVVAIKLDVPLNVLLVAEPTYEIGLTTAPPTRTAASVPGLELTP